MIREYPSRGGTFGRPGVAVPVDPSPPAPTRTYFPELDAYRGIAALLLVVFHTYTIASASLGGPLYGGVLDSILISLRLTGWFFTLSGFLLFLPFARAAIAQSAPRPVGPFLLRRALRILPLYYLALALMWPLRAARSVDPGEDLLRHLTFTHILDDRFASSLLLPAWSLAVEVAFYLFLVVFAPLAHRLCGCLPTPPMRAALLLGLLSVLALASAIQKGDAYFRLGAPAESLSTYYGPLAKADTFAVGMALAVAVAAGWPRLTGRWPMWALLGGLVAMGALIGVHGSGDGLAITFHILSSLAFALILSSTALAVGEPRWGRWLRCRSLGYLGRISYSVYLWHELVVLTLVATWLGRDASPIVFPAVVFGVVAGSLAMAIASHRYVERPCAHLADWLTRTATGRTAAPRRRVTLPVIIMSRVAPVVVGVVGWFGLVPRQE